MRHVDDRPHTPRLSKTPGTFSRGALPSGGRGRASTGRENTMPKAELPPEAPKPDASSRLSSSSSWTTAFYSTARGVNDAPAWVPTGTAPTHKHRPVPWGAYARVQRRSSSAQTKHDVMAFQEEVLTIAIEKLQHSKSALDDTPMPTDLPDDRSSEGASSRSFLGRTCRTTTRATQHRKSCSWE